MKIIIQSLLISFVLHVVYFTGSIIYGYFLTKTHDPDIAASYENVYFLQNEVAFGYVGSPLFIIFSFFGMAALVGLFIKFYKYQISK